MLYQSDKRQNKIKKIFANVISRKSVFFRRNLHIDYKNTNIKVIKAKPESVNLLTKINSKSFDNCFVFEHTSSLTFNNKRINLDIVGTNYDDTTIITTTVVSGKETTIDWTNIGVKNIWVFIGGQINTLGIKNNTIVGTKENL